MKPGMQRDILVAFWLLFDEFEIGNDDGDPPPRSPGERIDTSPDPKETKVR